jgi:PTH1 family peptidyl-tRNA hydrolase
LVVGLGNPGPKYAENRHNIGFMVVDELARRHRADSFRSKFGGELATAEINGAKALFLKPMQYMNVSGRAVQQAAAFYQLEPKDIVVVHDEIDLELGRLKVKQGGGHAGHNGIRSIAQDLASPDFARVRCGVGRPRGAKGNVADFVLGDFAKADTEEKNILIQEAADAVEAVLKLGPLLAMNQYNAREKEQSSPA